MFKRLTYIKDFGVFRNYKKTGPIQDFNKLNIIYGWNYSGKTTLARVFQCFEKEELHKDYSNCEFEFQDQDNSKYSESKLTIPGKKVRVFNSDFIQDNLNWDGKDFEPILILGKETKDAVDSIVRTEKRIDKIDFIKKERIKIYQDLENQIYDSKKVKARYIHDVLKLIEPFTQAHLKPLINQVRSNHAQFTVNEATKKILLHDATASEDNKLDILPEFSCNLELSQQIEKAKETIKEIPKFSQTIGYFVENPAVAAWVEKGLPLHEQKDSCEYCGNIISQERREILLAHFSDDLKQHKITLKQLISSMKTSKLEAPKTSSRDFYKSLDVNCSDAIDKLATSIKAHNLQLDKLITVVQTKIEKPFEKIIDLPGISDCTESLSESINTYNKAVQMNNKKTEAFDTIKANAIETLKKHYAAVLIAETNMLNKEKEIEKHKSREIALKETKMRAETKILKLEAQISEAQKGCKKLNEYIWKFLGSEEIKVEVIKIENKNRFTLKRGKNRAKNLSEGEKTAISFSYFLTKLLEDIELSNIIIYIDDPISSLDSNHIFQVNSLLNYFFFIETSENGSRELKCDQLFIATHNFDFFSLLRKLPITKSEKKYFLVKRINKEEATLQNLPNAISKYNSEYHYLFAQIHSFHTSNNKSDYEVLMYIPNAVRRFVELYTYSRLPGNCESKVDQRANELWGIESSKRIVKVLHHFSHSNNIEQMTKFPDLLCNIENAVTDIIDLLQKNDDRHYNQLVKAVNKN